MQINNIAFRQAGDLACTRQVFKQEQAIARIVRHSQNFIQGVAFAKKDEKWDEDVRGVLVRNQCEDLQCLGLLSYEDFSWQYESGEKLPPGKRAFAK
eukprot:10864713-Karenia_brevis.AAC.1